VIGQETIVNFSVSPGSNSIVIKAQGDYSAAPKLTKVTILGAGKGDEVKEVEVRVDLSKGGEIKW
jgi:hypothetical protein